jgi:DNA-binding response OmpR family regulator
MTEKVRGVAVAADLTQTEQTVFARLADKPETLVLRAELLDLLKGCAPHTIDSHIMAIRRKLKRHGSDAKVETVVGSGFILRLRPESGSQK